ncbi:MAG TPA: hypothetical protein VMU84_09780 [Thermoanaerobaculia bacterium]|nr:hypothetical protein [Thermoanaerobaculia bacterium]
MRLKNLITAASIALLPIAASAAQIIVPVAGTGPGAGNSQWQSELTLHNTSAKAITASMKFHQGEEVSAAVALNVAARATSSIADIVKTQFGKESGTGAITIDLSDADAAKLAVASRTFNASSAGEFGQDIPAFRSTEASIGGDIVVLAGPSSATSARFNFGLYVVDAAKVNWEVLRANGTVAASRELDYTAGTHVQYNGGIKSLLGVDAADNDTIHATVKSGRAIFYGSAINNLTGDPQYVAGVRTREEIRINFAGIDLDEDGTVDLTDSDHDGVLDATISMATSLFPNYFRVVAAGENGEKVTFEIVNSSADAALLDNEGTVQLAPGGNLKGTKGELRLRATAAGSSSILVIPINFL